MMDQRVREEGIKGTMAYGDYDGPNKDDKGQENGSCNRTLCQAPDAIWYNHGSYSWYCADCRRDIQFDSFNQRDWKLNFEVRCGHPMFETREMMDEREAQKIAEAAAEEPHRPHLDGLGLRDFLIEDYTSSYWDSHETYGSESNPNMGRKARDQIRAGAVKAGVAKETRQQRRARERASRKAG